MSIDIKAHNELVKKTFATLGASHLLKDVKFNWSNRMTSSMGTALYDFKIKKGFIVFSIPLWHRATPEERDEVIVHEICHIVANWRAGHCAKHGPLWQQAMRECGYKNPRCCHDVDNSDLQRKRPKYRFHCGCHGGHEVGGVVAKRIIAGRKYKCLKCKEYISPPKKLPLL